MAEGKKISELELQTELDNGCCFPMVHNGETRRVLFETIKRYCEGQKGDKGDAGRDGVSITSIVQTTVSTEDEGDNIFTVYFSDDTQTILHVRNGSRGSQGDAYVITEEDKEEIAQIAIDDCADELDDLRNEVNSLKSENRTQSYRIENLEAMAEGKIKVDHVEDTENGVLDLPSGSLAPYAEVEKVMGRSLCWNQLNDVVSITESNEGYYRATGTISLVSGHWYAFLFHLSYALTSADGQVYLSGVYTEYGLGTSTDFVKLVHPSENGTEMVYLNVRRQLTTPIVVTCRVIDLSIMFSSGNEPTSVNNPRIAWIKNYADAHPEYNAGEVLDSTPTEVRSRGANVLSVSNYAKTSDTGYGTTFTPYEDGVLITGTGTGNHYGVGIASTVHKRLVNGKRYYLSSNASASGLSWAIRLIKGGVTTYVQDFTMDSTVQEVVCYIQTTSAFTASGTKVALCLSEMNAYTPYRTPSTLTLPSLTLKQGDIYDPKTGEVKETWGKVDLGTLAYSYRNDGSGYAPYFYANVSSLGIKLNGAVTSKQNALCAKYTIVARSGFANTDMTFCLDGNDTQITQVQFKDSRYTDPTAFKSTMNGVMLLYELATPTTRQETPIAEPFIEVEAGGTVSVVSDGAQADARIHYQSQLV